MQQNSKNFFKYMCRACMTTIGILHPLSDESATKTLTFNELFASTIPQLPIHNNDELPKLICVSCINSLTAMHKFQQMCIASDTYMRSLLVSLKLTSVNIVSGRSDENRLTSRSPCSVNVKKNQALIDFLSEPTEEYPKDELNSEIFQGDEISYVPEVCKIEVEECQLEPVVIKIELPDIEKDYTTCEDSLIDSSHSGAQNCKDIHDECICDHCGKVFTTKAEMKRHILLLTDNESLHRCIQCKKKFSSASKLKAHQRYQCCEKPYKCRYCKRSFIFESQIKTHELVMHSADNSYLCEQCGKAFSYLSILKLHERMHTKNKNEKLGKRKKRKI